MILDRTHFLLLTATLAAGGAAGWALRDQDALGTEAAKVRIETVQRGDLVAPPEAAPPPPVCDDSTATAKLEACPPMGPAEEGVCSNIAAKRCADFKTAFKPRVAEAAVNCIKALKGGELCDAARVNLCGHTALMLACQDADPKLTANTQDQGLPLPPPSAVATTCESIVKGCGASPSAPSVDECRRTVSGMNDAGRAAMLSCMATHCGDRGLIGCEAMTDPVIHARIDG